MKVPEAHNASYSPEAKIPENFFLGITQAASEHNRD